MAVQGFKPSAVAARPPPGLHPVTGSRPQVGIQRLPSARRISNEPRESMNCKSCRKRKIKCNRLRPSCEACQVFQCPCIYDAVPKKRGPKTDVLEALLKRVDGLEQQLKDKNSAEPGSPSPKDVDANMSWQESSINASPSGASAGDDRPSLLSLAEARDVQAHEDPIIYSPVSMNESFPSVQPDALLDIYFARIHGKPFHVLDESSLRQKLQLNQAPAYLVHAIYSVASRSAPIPGGYQPAAKMSESYAIQARNEIDMDAPSVDAIQALLLLVIAFTAAGKGRKAYMLLANAVGMLVALQLHREMDTSARVTPIDREIRRRIFWTCYLLDRFMACGSKRPCLMGDEMILLRLPSWSPSPAALPVEGNFFQNGANPQYTQGAGSGKTPQGSSGMLIDISRILGRTNRYLATGGVKGDSHFPWHSQSTLSKIRGELDAWAAGTEEIFNSVDALFGRSDSTVLVLAKLIYHLVHCLIYRPFLPIDLAELLASQGGQHQSWQIEATNICFLHANAIAELVDLGSRASAVEWPAFVGFCICTAGTVHVHGAHYTQRASHGGGDSSGVFAASAEFLSREMQQLADLRYVWAGVQHQRETLQTVCTAHAELASSLADTSLRGVGGVAASPPVFQLEDFFDRYASVAGGRKFGFDAASLDGVDIAPDFVSSLSAGGGGAGLERPGLGGRRNTAPPGWKRPDFQDLPPLGPSQQHPTTPGIPTPRHQLHHTSHYHGATAAFHQQTSPSVNMPHTPTSLAPSHHESGTGSPLLSGGGGGGDPANSAVVAVAAAAGFALPGHHHQHQHHHQQAHSGLSAAPAFNTAYVYTSPHVGASGFEGAGGFGGGHGHGYVGSASATARSPGGRSAGSGSIHEERDPFLSLLEQLNAENEAAGGTGGTGTAGGHGQGHGGTAGGASGNELDFFLSGTAPQG